MEIIALAIIARAIQQSEPKTDGQGSSAPGESSGPPPVPSPSPPSSASSVVLVLPGTISEQIAKRIAPVGASQQELANIGKSVETFTVPAPITPEQAAALNATGAPNVVAAAIAPKLPAAESAVAAAIGSGPGAQASLSQVQNVALGILVTIYKLVTTQATVDQTPAHNPIPAGTVIASVDTTQPNYQEVLKGLQAQVGSFFNGSPLTIQTTTVSL